MWLHVTDTNGTKHKTGNVKIKCKRRRILDARAGKGSKCVGLSVSELQGAELLVHGQDVGVELGREQQVLQGPHVLLDGHVVLRDEGRDAQIIACSACATSSIAVCATSYHEEDLLQPLDAVLVPGRADVDAARLTADQMLRQQHDEALREGETAF